MQCLQHVSFLSRTGLSLVWTLLIIAVVNTVYDSLSVSLSEADYTNTDADSQVIGHKQIHVSCHSIAFDLCVVLLASSGGSVHRETEEWVILWSLIIFHTWLDLQEVKGLCYQECYGLIPFITPQAWHEVDMFIVGLAWLHLSDIINNRTYFMASFRHHGAWRLYFDSLWRKLKLGLQNQRILFS